MRASKELESLHPQLRSLIGDPEPVTRRAFMVTSLGAGFALAVLPVSAQAITTSSEGLVAGEVKVPVKDGQIPTYRAMPATGNNFPTILVVQEVFGVHDELPHGRQIAARRRGEYQSAGARTLWRRRSRHSPRHYEGDRSCYEEGRQDRRDRHVSRRTTWLSR